MKKIAKLSLVASVAIAGLTSANAGALEDAIKNTDISGTAVYRYDDRSTDNDATESFSNESNNSYKIAATIKSKVNEDITFNSRTVIGSGNGMAAIETDGADGEAGFSLTQANFSYTGIANTTVIAGKQAVPSPFAVQADGAGDEDTGTGITAVTSVGPVTVAATYLNNTNLSVGSYSDLVPTGTTLSIGDKDLAGLGLMGNFSGVALDAWYLDIAETSAKKDGHQAYTIGAATKISPVSLYARYSAVEHDATNEEESLWKVGAKAKLGMIGFGIDYGQTNKVKTFVSGVAVTGDADAKVNLQGWGLNLNSNDSTLLKLNVNASLTKEFAVSANYNTKETGSVDSEEYYGQLTYKPSKNFMTYLRIGQVENDAKPNNDNTRGRLHVQYSF